MDTKKPVALPDQFLSVRKKVVPGLGLWVGASFIILSVLFLSSSLNGRVVSPLAFQGFNNVGANSSSRVSWPFSLASSRRSNFSHSVSSNGSSSDMHSLGVILEKTQMENLVEKDKNGSSSDGSVDFRNFSGESGEINDFERTHLGNFSDGMSNGSLHVEDGTVAGNFSLSSKGDVDASRSTGGKSLDNYSGVNSSSIVNGSEGYSPNATVEMGGVADGGNGGEDDEIQNKRERSLEDCDIYDGRWVRDDWKPLYPPGSCPHIDRAFNCHLNGRPDDGFVKWKWQPNGCDIPRMNATDFLERLRGKKMVFVGDSLNRNMWESLVCILRHSIRRKKHVYEISGRSEFKKKGFYAFRFEDYNCTVDFVGSPFLVRESSFNTRNRTLETLRLDLMDKTTSMYHDADIIVFNTGHWWTHEKTSRGEDYYQEGNHVHQRLKVLEAYRRALLTWAKWVDENIDSNKTQVIFRGYSVTHFKGGQWNSGGRCHKETDPIFDDKYLGKYPSKMRALQPVLQEMKTPIMYLNISRLTDYRKDAHPSIYRMEYKTPDERIAAERSQDCSHWCLPGVPDTWNELLYASLLKAGRGSWRI